MALGELSSSIEFQMSFLLFIALGGYLLASRINQSAVIGEILVGLLVGPSILGLITYTDFVSSIAHLGAVVLLFVVGLEFRLKDLINIKYGIIALFGVVVPWIAGYYTAGLFGFGFGSSVFVATAMTATSIAITANVLKEMGKLQTEAAKAIIGAAVIDDVLGLLALSISGQLVSGTLSYAPVALTVLKAGAFLVLGSYIGHNILSRLIVRIDDSKIARKYPEFVFIFAMMSAFLYGMVAEAIGLSAIVGSFIAGISLEGVDLRFSKHYKEGADYLRIIFGSVFFVSLGVLADIKALTPDVIAFMTVLTAVAVLTKVIGCGIPARLQRMSMKDSLIIGFGMVPRGEVAMIIALIGLNQGVFGQDIYVSLVLMSLLTTLMAPLALRNWLYGERASRTYRFRA